MTSGRCLKIAMAMFSLFAVSGFSSDNSYVVVDSIGSVAVVYGMPLEELERRLLEKLPGLPDLMAAKTKVQFANLAEGDQTVSVLNAPQGMIGKEALLAWMPDPKKMVSIPGKWTKDDVKRSTVFLTIGCSRVNPFRSFLIFAREWSVKGGSSIPRTGIPLPFKMWTRWPQLLKSDIEFVDSLGSGVATTILQRGTLFDERLFVALGLSPKPSEKEPAPERVVPASKPPR